MRKFVMSFIIGMGFGIASLLTILALSGVGTVSTGALWMVSLCSGTIGIYSVALLDYLELSSALFFTIHCLLTIFVCAGMLIGAGFLEFHQLLSWHYVLTFFVLYLLIWSVVFYINHQDIGKINHQLLEKRRENKRIR